jgi:mRNA interferase MazF
VRRAGDVALVQFPFADMTEAKLRPVLLIGQVSGNYADWLICMISSRTHQHIQGFDELIGTDEPDFRLSGLKVPSVIRIGRLLTVEERLLLAQLGSIGPERLRRIRRRLGQWMLDF